MPHAGLMVEREMGDEEGPLLRARLHIRSGRRRLRQGKIAAGIVTLYDALIGAIEWYFASPERRSMLIIKDNDNLKDEKNLYKILVRSGVLDGRFDFEEFVDKVVDRATYDEMRDYDYTYILKAIEDVMTQIGVMPFDEEELPAEDPSVF